MKKAPRTHLVDARADTSSYVHRVSVCGMQDTATRPLVMTTASGLVDCSRCREAAAKVKR